MQFDDYKTDQQLLQWIHDRLVHVHKEHESYGYMWQLRAAISRANSTKPGETLDSKSDSRYRVGRNF